MKLRLSMRSFLTISLLCLSGLSFTQNFKDIISEAGTNQSYMHFDNGEVSTVRSYYPEDNDLKLIKADHVFILPSDIDEARANYLFTKDGRLYTVDANGFMYLKEFYSIDSKVKHFGGNYFITQSGQIHIIKNDGIIIHYEEIEGVDLRRLSVVGGNYFITKDDRLFVIDFRGYYSEKTDLFTIKTNSIKYIGHNYFITKEGVVHSFGTEVVGQIDSDGNILRDASNNIIPLLDSNGDKQYYSVYYINEDSKINSVSKMGGNYFFDDQNYIHTIGLNGVLDRGVTGRKIKVNLVEDKDRSLEVPAFFGNNYFVYEDGSVYTVDRNGYFYYLTQIEERISTTNFERKLNKK